MQHSAAGQRAGHKNHRQQQSLKKEVESPVQTLVETTRDCIRANPEAAALWCLGIGFILGWKLKPW